MDGQIVSFEALSAGVEEPTVPQGTGLDGPDMVIPVVPDKPPAEEAAQKKPAPLKTQRKSKIPKVCKS